MSRHGVSEDEAYHRLRRTAMDRSMKLVGRGAARGRDGGAAVTEPRAAAHRHHAARATAPRSWPRTSSACSRATASASSSRSSPRGRTSATSSPPACSTPRTRSRRCRWRRRSASARSSSRPSPRSRSASAATPSPCRRRSGARWRTSTPRALETAATRGRALARVVAARRAAGAPPLRLATVFPVSMHTYELRYWLAAFGIQPDRDVELCVVPPPRMVAELESGAVDGFCVGEPWSSVAVAARQRRRPAERARRLAERAREGARRERARSRRRTARRTWR